MGVGSSLIYAPANFAETPELVALAKASAQCGGMYISHMRNESDHLIEAVDELIEIARGSGGPAEIYHLKQAGTRQLGQARRRHRAGRGGARAGSAHHRRHVHLYRRRDRARRGDAAVGAGGRLRRMDEAAARIPAIRARVHRRDDAPSRRLGKSLLVRRAAPTDCCCSAFKNADAQAAIPARRWPRSPRCAAPAPRTPRSTW